MRKWLTISLLTLGLVGFARWAGNSFANPLAQCASVSITVNGADGTRCESTQSSSALTTLLTAVLPRTWFGSADSSRIEQLVAAPAGLSNSLVAVPARVQFGQAESSRIEPLTAPPSSFQSNLATMTDRVFFRSADGSRSEISLAFPLTIIKDTVSPQLALAPGSTRDRLVWTTNEFAECVFKYGLSSGSLTQTVQKSGFYTTHTADITGIPADRVYFYQLTCTDISGNSASSAVIEVDVAPSTPEPTATPTPGPTATPDPVTNTDQFVYLPYVTR